jgi:Protein of unknown function (DUF1203)
VSFRVSPLPLAPFQKLFALDEAALVAHGARWVIASADTGFPCRVSLALARRGERVILVRHQHQPADTPFRASGPIFVREAAEPAELPPDTVPEGSRRNLLSVRVYDAEGKIEVADGVPGAELEPLVDAYLGQPVVAYIHLHYASRGCYAARVDRT